MAGCDITTYSLSTTDDHLSLRVEISLDKIVRHPSNPCIVRRQGLRIDISKLIFIVLILYLGRNLMSLKPWYMGGCHSGRGRPGESSSRETGQWE